MVLLLLLPSRLKVKVLFGRFGHVWLTNNKKSVKFLINLLIPHTLAALCHQSHRRWWVPRDRCSLLCCLYILFNKLFSNQSLKSLTRVLDQIVTTVVQRQSGSFNCLAERRIRRDDNIRLKVHFSLVSNIITYRVKRRRRIWRVLLGRHAFTAICQH